MDNIYIIILFSIILLVVIFSVFIIYKMYLRYVKMHYVISSNSAELEKIKKILVGEESSFTKMENKIDGIHTAVSTQLVKGLMNNSR